MPYPTICATTTSIVVPWNLNFLHLDNLLRRIAFARLRLRETKYGQQWEFWPKEAFAWFLERWEYLLLEQLVSSQKRSRVLIGCVIQRKRRADDLLHFEELTGWKLPTGSIHLSRFAGSKTIEKLHLLRFFLAIYGYATERNVEHVYAVMREELLDELRRRFPNDSLIENIPGECFYHCGYVFKPVRITVRHFESYATILRDPLGEMEKHHRPRKGGARRLKRVIEARQTSKT
jgi:hypothetical protein